MEGRERTYDSLKQKRQRTNEFPGPTPMYKYKPRSHYGFRCFKFHNGLTCLHRYGASAAAGFNPFYRGAITDLSPCTKTSGTSGSNQSTDNIQDHRHPPLNNLHIHIQINRAAKGCDICGEYQKHPTHHLHSHIRWSQGKVVAVEGRERTYDSLKQKRQRTNEFPGSNTYVQVQTTFTLRFPLLQVS